MAAPERAGKRADKTRDSQQSHKPAGIIYIKERYFTMLKKDLILRNPLRVMGYENDDILSTGQFGAVLARAGVGKTAFLVQLSLNALLRGKNVLHISLEDPVNKVSSVVQRSVQPDCRSISSGSDQPALGFIAAPPVYYDLSGRGIQCAQATGTAGGSDGTEHLHAPDDHCRRVSV